MKKVLFDVLVTIFIFTYFYKLALGFNDKEHEKLVTLNICSKCDLNGASLTNSDLKKGDLVGWFKRGLLAR